MMYATVRYGMIRYHTVRYMTPRYDKVCYDMVSFFFRFRRALQINHIERLHSPAYPVTPAELRTMIKETPGILLRSASPFGQLKSGPIFACCKWRASNNCPIAIRALASPIISRNIAWATFSTPLLRRKGGVRPTRKDIELHGATIQAAKILAFGPR